MNAERMKFIEEINKKFGKNAIRRASEIMEERAIRISSGSLSLDIALGGGIPLGRFIQISGAFSSTKSSLAYHIMRNFQQSTKEEYVRKLVKKGNERLGTRDVFEFEPTGNEIPLYVALMQSEAESYTNAYAQQIGINTDELFISYSAGMEESLEIAHRLQEQMLADLIVHDSLEAYVPMKEYDSAMDESTQMGLKPKILGEYFRKFQATNNYLSRMGMLPVTVIGINQLREKIGSYGDPEYTPGGRAKDFAASIDLRLRRGDWITIGSGENKQIIGQQVKFKVHKNKTGVPQRTGTYDFYFDDGGPVPPGHIDNVKEAVIEGIAYGVITRSGNWYQYGDIRVQGADAFLGAMREYIDDNPEAYEELRNEIMRVALETDADVEDRFGEDDDDDDDYVDE